MDHLPGGEPAVLRRVPGRVQFVRLEQPDLAPLGFDDAGLDQAGTTYAFTVGYLGRFGSGGGGAY